jgi:hypothetical protein
VTESAAAPDKATARALAAERVLLKVRPSADPSQRSIKATAVKPGARKNAKATQRPIEKKKSLARVKGKKGARG